MGRVRAVLRIFVVVVMCVCLSSFLFGCKGHAAEKEYISLINANADAHTVSLFHLLQDNYGVKVFSGQYINQYIDYFGGDYDSVLDVEELIAVHSVTGEYPAVLGIDCSQIEKDGYQTAVVEQAIEWYNMGGIVTMCWHWIDPKYRSSFYTENTAFDFGAVMNGEDPVAYDQMLADIDKVSDVLKEISAAGVPILWRPLHEASGGWFWWGSAGAENYISLYQLMYERMTVTNGLNNLIWVWNGQSSDWYPGDSYVDMIGEDAYPSKIVYDYSPAMVEYYSRAKNSTTATKMIALSECNYLPNLDRMTTDNANWLMFIPWCREFVNDGQGNYLETYVSSEQLLSTYQNEKVITLNDLSNINGEIRLK